MRGFSLLIVVVMTAFLGIAQVTRGNSASTIMYFGAPGTSKGCCDSSKLTLISQTHARMITPGPPGKIRYNARVIPLGEPVFVIGIHEKDTLRVLDRNGFVYPHCIDDTTRYQVVGVGKEKKDGHVREFYQFYSPYTNSCFRAFRAIPEQSVLIFFW